MIGRSVEGRAIRAIEVGERSRPATLVVGCIHGSECAGAAVAWRLVAARPRAHVWVIPNLNPDGLARGSRQNARGVDLNRNWPAGWRARGRPWDGYYPGPRPLSEPETRAARAVILRVRPRVTIWFHQPLGFVWATGRSLPAARRYARLTGLALRNLPSPPGAATRWQRRRFPTASAFVVELSAGRLSARAVQRHAAAATTLANQFASRP